MFNKLLLALFILLIVFLLGWCSPQCSRQITGTSQSVTDAATKGVAGATATVGTGLTAAGEGVEKAVGAAASAVGTATQKMAESGKAVSATVAGAAALATGAQRGAESAEENQIEEPAPRPEDFSSVSPAGDGAGSGSVMASGDAGVAPEDDGMASGDGGGPKGVASLATVGDSIILEGIQFRSNSSELLPKSRAVLDGVIVDLQRHASVRVEVLGYTDNTGDPAYNLELSKRRAQVVVDYLVAGGVGANRLTAKGYGGATPIADNATAAGRAKNRRVEMRVIE